MAYSDFSFFHDLRVRWSEVDMQSVVFNGNYLNYFDVALTEYTRAVGLPSPLIQAAQGAELFVKKTTLEYHASARFDDDLKIGVRCHKLGNSSMTIVIEIYRDDDFLVGGETVYVYVNTAEGKSTPIPSDWMEMLDRFETKTSIQKKILIDKVAI
jgi:acyl-CoA thioester hydrolase